MADSIVIDVGGTEVTVSHPDKVFFSKRGETKLDLNLPVAASSPGAKAGAPGMAEGMHKH